MTQPDADELHDGDPAAGIDGLETDPTVETGEDSSAGTDADDPAASELSAEQSIPAVDPITAQRDQHLEDLQRVSAEFANFRKRTEKRNAEVAAQAGSRIGEALLPVLDACDAALQQGVEGIDQIAAQLRGVLESYGLEVIQDDSEGFDPNRHEAAMSEPGDDGQTEPVVAQVLRTGYAWNGRVLRAAMVKVKG